MSKKNRDKRQHNREFGKPARTVPPGYNHSAWRDRTVPRLTHRTNPHGEQEMVLVASRTEVEKTESALASGSNGCPQEGNMGMHSESYSEGKPCEWCGAVTYQFTPPNAVLRDDVQGRTEVIAQLDDPGLAAPLPNVEVKSIRQLAQEERDRRANMMRARLLLSVLPGIKW